LEGEPCPNFPDNFNGGCDAAGGVNVSPVICGESICGNLWQVGPNKDKDIYEITLTEDDSLVWSVYSNISVIIEIQEPLSGCAGTIVLAQDYAARCDTAKAFVCLSAGTYWLSVTTSAPINVPCEPYTARVDCYPCDPCPSCPPTALHENEPCPNYNDTYNGGCTSGPPVALPIACGDTICGSAYFMDIGDQDFYEIEIFERDTVTWCIEADFFAEAGIYTPAAACPDMIVHAFGSAPPCVPLCLSVCLEPGVYWLRVSPTSYTGGVCKPYVASVHCAPCPEGQPCTYAQLDFDPDNDFCWMNFDILTLDCGDTICGDIISSTDRDWFMFSILPGQPCVNLNIDVFGNDTPGQFPFSLGLDPLITLYADDCSTQVAFDDNSGVGIDARLTTSCLPPGRYSMEILGVGGTIGPYVLALSCEPCACPPPCPYPDQDDEPNNNSCATIDTEIRCQDTLCGEIQPGLAPDVDWYLFVATGPDCQSLTLDLFGNDTPGYFGYLAGLDPVIELWDEFCTTQLSLDDNSGVGNDSRLISNCLVPGNYYVRISGANIDNVGPYVLAVDCNSCVCPDSCPYPNVDFDPANDFCDQANAVITCGDTLCGDIIASLAGLPPDLDWYEILLPGPGCAALDIDIFANSTPGFSPFGGGLNPTVWLWNSSCGELLEFDWDSGTGEDSRLESGCLPPGTYRVAVEGVNQSSGPYVLAIACRQCICPCSVACPPGYAIDGEVCPNLGTDFWNGGCVVEPPIVAPIYCSDRRCATSFAMGGIHDEDWYELTLTSPRRILWRVTAEFPFEMGIYRPIGGCDSLVTIRYTTGDPCQTRGLFAWCLGAGTYYFVVSPTVYNGYPCSDYNMRLRCGYCFVIAVAVSKVGDSIKLAWDPDETEPVYTIHRGSTPDFRPSDETSLASTTDTEFIDQDILNSGANRYFYVVVMEDQSDPDE
jgi:hypothetical protein